MRLLSTLICPHWGYRSPERMPTNACQVEHECKGSGALLTIIRRL